MLCANCGKPVKDAAKFCTDCGARQIETPAQVTPTMPQPIYLVDEFKQGYEQGRKDTREVVSSGEMSNEYAHKIASNIFSLSFVIGVISFFVLWTGLKLNVFFAMLISLFLTFVMRILFAVVLVGVIGSNKKKND